MLVHKLSFGLLLFCSSLVLAQPFEGRAAPSKRYAAPHPAPSKRFAELVAKPAPSKRFAEFAAAPIPSKRFAEFAAAPIPSKRFAEFAAAPIPSKRYADPEYAAPTVLIRRNSPEQQIISPEFLDLALSSLLCPASMNACPISATSLPAPGVMPRSVAEWRGVEHECVNFSLDLHSCGGCAAVDASRDCASIPGVFGVSCVVGQCQVSSCRQGYILAADGKSCTGDA